MSGSLIQLLNQPRILARIAVATTAAATRALADSHAVPLREGDQLFWQEPDGRRLPIEPEQGEDGQHTT